MHYKAFPFVSICIILYTAGIVMGASFNPFHWPYEIRIGTGCILLLCTLIAFIDDVIVKPNEDGKPKK